MNCSSDLTSASLSEGKVLNFADFLTDDSLTTYDVIKLLFYFWLKVTFFDNSTFRLYYDAKLSLRLCIEAQVVFKNYLDLRMQQSSLVLKSTVDKKVRNHRTLNSGDRPPEPLPKPDHVVMPLACIFRNFLSFFVSSFYVVESGNNSKMQS